MTERTWNDGKSPEILGMVERRKITPHPKRRNHGKSPEMPKEGLGGDRETEKRYGFVKPPASPCKEDARLITFKTADRNKWNLFAPNLTIKYAETSSSDRPGVLKTSVVDRLANEETLCSLPATENNVCECDCVSAITKSLCEPRCLACEQAHLFG